MTNEEYNSYLAAVTASATGAQADISTWSQDDPVRENAIITFGACHGKTSHAATPDEIEHDLKVIEKQLKGDTDE